MTKKLQITIPKPCSENWYAMTPEEKGRFCTTCNKTVYDFTNSSDREIMQTYTNHKKLCGRFLITQLDREITVSKEKKSIWLASLFLGMLSLANTKMASQNKPKMEQGENKQQILGKVTPKTAVEDDKEIEIQGNVVDNVGALPGVNVIVKGTDRGTSTGFEGEYKIKAKKGDLLVFSFMGMEVEERTISSSNYINVKMQDSKTVLAGEVVVVKRNFF